jgi:hypothetical protein
MFSNAIESANTSFLWSCKNTVRVTFTICLYQMVTLFKLARSVMSVVTLLVYKWSLLYVTGGLLVRGYYRFKRTCYCLKYINRVNPPLMVSLASIFTVLTVGQKQDEYFFQSVLPLSSVIASRRRRFRVSTFGSSFSKGCWDSREVPAIDRC